MKVKTSYDQTDMSAVVITRVIQGDPKK